MESPGEIRLYSEGEWALYERWRKKLEPGKNLFKYYSIPLLTALVGIICISVWRGDITGSPIGESLAFAMLGFLTLSRARVSVLPLSLGLQDFDENMSEVSGMVPIRNLNIFKVMMKFGLVYAVMPFVLLALLEGVVYYFGDSTNYGGVFPVSMEQSDLAETIFLGAGTILQGLAYFNLSFLTLLLYKRIFPAYAIAAIIPIASFSSLFFLSRNGDVSSLEWTQYLVFPGFWMWMDSLSSETNACVNLIIWVLILNIILIPLILSAINWRRGGRFSFRESIRK
jgi:hypothetical protein